MPRRIDADARVAEIAQASLRVLERDGLAGLSVRGVAEEAGIATASLRRAFPTQHALREHCFNLIEDRVTARIQALDLSGRELVEALLAQLLPLDRERRLERVAQLQLGVLALTDPRLRPSARHLDDAVDRGCSYAVAILVEAGRLDPGRNPEYEVQRLRALLDGLALHLMWSAIPEHTDSRQQLDQVPATLLRHLDDLERPV